MKKRSSNMPASSMAVRRTTMQAPETQSTNMGDLPSDLRLSRFRVVTGFRGNHLDSKDERPNRAVSGVGNARAEFCSRPFSSRIRGPMIATRGFSFMNLTEALKNPDSTSVSGFSSTAYFPCEALSA